MRRTPYFTIYAVLSSLLWLPAVIFSGLPATSIGRAYIAVAGTIFIPLYLVQHVISLGLTAIIEPGIATQIGTWGLALLVFVALDLIRVRNRPQ